VCGLGLAGLLGASSCAGSHGASGTSATSSRRQGAAIEFAFPPTEGQAVSSATTRGRVTLLAFVTTYDIASQVLLRRLAEVIARFTPRTNAVAVVMEAPLYAELLPAYRDSLSLPFPMVMADFATQQGNGPFGDIQAVPTVVVLDREGRETWRHQGPLTAKEISAALRAAGG
jgi:hypothetical protein